MYRGYVKTWRRILEWEWYTDYKTCHLFRHCILRANIEDKIWHGVEIKKGSFATSYEKLALETGLTKKEVRTALDKLKRTHDLAHEGHSSYSIITVKNWDKFQPEGTQLGTQRATTKEIKEIKEKEIYKEKEKKNISYPSLEEIKNYCQERNNGVDPQQFYDYYSVANWKDRDGKPVKNWKQKMIATWEKKQTKKPANSKDNVLRIADRLLNIESKKEESETAQKETQEVRTNEQRRIYKGISHPI